MDKEGASSRGWRCDVATTLPLALEHLSAAGEAELLLPARDASAPQLGALRRLPERTPARVYTYLYLYAPVCTRDGRGKLTDRTTSLMRMMGVLRPELEGRTQRLYSSSRNWEQEWMSTPARCFLWSAHTGFTAGPPSNDR